LTRSRLSRLYIYFFVKLDIYGLEKQVFKNENDFVPFGKINKKASVDISGKILLGPCWAHFAVQVGPLCRAAL